VRELVLVGLDPAQELAVQRAADAVRAGRSLLVVETAAAADADRMQIANRAMNLTIPESILFEAERITNGQRQKDYGDALTNHERIAGLWNAWFRGRRETGDLTAEEIAALMVLMKIARLQASGTRDSLVDIAGYANVIDKMSQQRADRAARMADEL
jgi:hypothetical protein